MLKKRRKPGDKRKNGRSIALEAAFFACIGTRVETRTAVVYWLNRAGLSRSYRGLLAEIVDGISAMGLTEQGKVIRVGLKAASP